MSFFKVIKLYSSDFDYLQLPEDMFRVQKVKDIGIPKVLEYLIIPDQYKWNVWRSFWAAQEEPGVTSLFVCRMADEGEVF